MPVKEEVEALRASGATPHDIANHRARRLEQHMHSMARPYTRNGYRFNITEFGVETRTLEQMHAASGSAATLQEWQEETGITGPVDLLRLVVTVRVAPAGAVIIAATDLLNPMFFHNPPFMARDGAGGYREDMTEALRVMLDEKLAAKLAQGAQANG